jgi:hypothetical protein
MCWREVAPTNREAEHDRASAQERWWCDEGNAFVAALCGQKRSKKHEKCRCCVGGHVRPLVVVDGTRLAVDLVLNGPHIELPKSNAPEGVLGCSMPVTCPHATNERASEGANDERSRPVGREGEGREGRGRTWRRNSARRSLSRRINSSTVAPRLEDASFRKVMIPFFSSTSPFWCAVCGRPRRATHTHTTHTHTHTIDRSIDR